MSNVRVRHTARAKLHATSPAIQPLFKGPLIMNPVEPVQRQLEAYNAKDLKRVVAEYTEDVQVFRPPQTEPVLSGKKAFSEHYGKNRFTLPRLHAEVVNRIVAGNKVVDHERVSGLQEGIVEAIVVYEVVGGRIRTVWFY